MTQDQGTSSDLGRANHWQQKLPWPLVAATLVAMTAHYMTSGRFVGLPIAGALLVLSRLTNVRLPATRSASWVLRITAFSTILLLDGLPEQDVVMWYLKPAYTTLIGHLLAAEIVIRAWERIDVAHATERRGIILLAACLIMVMASNTYERATIRLCAPLFVVFVMFSLRRIAPRPKSASRRWRYDLLRATLAAVALGAGLGVVEGVTRFDQRLSSWATQLFNRRRPPRQTEIGLTATPRLGGVFNPDPSTDRVLLIDGPYAQRHVRAMAFDIYDDRQWLPVLRDRTFAAYAPPNPDASAPGRQTLSVLRIGGSVDVIYLPEGATDLSTAHAVERDDAGTIRFREEFSSERYEVGVRNASSAPEAMVEPPDADHLRRALQIPSTLSPLVVELATKAAGEGPAEMKLVRLVNRLRSEHQYSLSFDPPADVDPLSDFILNRRSAHCQYFASAIVMMARAAGIPARFVTGYYAHESYGDGETVVRQCDAHAWAECWIEGRGWMTVDATPPSGLPDQRFAPASWWQRMWERVQDIPRKVREWLAGLSRRNALILIAIPTLGWSALSSARWLINRRRRRHRFNAINDAYAEPDAELKRIARRFEGALARRGISPNRSQTWRQRISEVPGPRDSIQTYLRFVDAYDEARFGQVNRGDLRQLFESIEKDG